MPWTNPNLNGETVSYHRATVLQWSPWRYVEFGWEKIPSGYRGLMVYNSGGGDINVPISGISAAQHLFMGQHDPNNGKYWFYMDGANVYNQNANFSSGNAVTAGGEIMTGGESMGHTENWDLRYLQRNSNGTFVFVSWNGYVPYAVDPPYYNTAAGPNAFYDDGP